MRHRVACLAVLLLAATCLVLAQVDEGLAARDRERAWANLKASKIARQHRITSWNLPEGYQLPSGKLTGPRPPGTLLLNMLIKNEREHLDRTLPKWAKIIDCWIIGVDDANTDDSPEVIMKHLGHIPGKIMTVHFDGMGPTWTELVKEGVVAFPQCTHGIIADADFAPMQDTMDKMQLDIRCSKHMYTIWTEDHRNERKMDWIYRNVHGAHVARRTHQILEVPEFEDQEVFQTLVDLHIDEREGGYQDRTPGKMQRYIGFLEKDLEEWPNDTRSMYYLGYAHLDIFLKNKDNPTAEDWEALKIGVDYFKRRVGIDAGNDEEMWFTQLKIAEIYERFYKDWPEAEKWYLNCTRLDPDRADAWFYLGQHYRLVNDAETAIKYLKKAASMAVPQRSLFQWHYLYQCLSKIEYGRALLQLPNISAEEAAASLAILRYGNCDNGDPGNKAELHSQIKLLQSKLAPSKRSLVSERVRPVRLLHRLFKNNRDALRKALSVEDVDRNAPGLSEDVFNHLDVDAQGNTDMSYYSVMRYLVSQASAYRAQFIKLRDSGDKSVAMKYLEPCGTFRGATLPFLRFVRFNKAKIAKMLERTQLGADFEAVVTELRSVCR